MARILSFKVQGLAGRSDLVSHSLKPDLNIFWGLNGSGKTSLLKILHCALGNTAEGLDTVEFRRADVVIEEEIEIEVGEERYTFKVEIRRTYDKTHQSKIEGHPDSDEAGPLFDASVEQDTFDFEPPTPLSAWRNNLIAIEGIANEDVEDQLMRVRKSNIHERRFRHSYLPITRLSEGRYSRSSRRSPFNVSNALDSDQLFEEQVKNTWREYSSRSLSQIRDIQQEGLAKVLSILFGQSGTTTPSAIDASDFPTASAAYTIVTEFMREQQIKLLLPKYKFIRKFEESAEHREVVHEIQSVTRNIDDVLMPQRVFQFIIEQMYRGDKRIIISRRSPVSTRETRISPYLSMESNNSKIPLKSLSSGEKQLLVILLEVLSADDTPVIIDEPELSLHVDWQRLLVESMHGVNSHCQVILASHSPEIIAESPYGRVFEL